MELESRVEICSRHKPKCIHDARLTGVMGISRVQLSTFVGSTHNRATHHNEHWNSQDHSYIKKKLTNKSIVFQQPLMSFKSVSPNFNLKQ